MIGSDLPEDYLNFMKSYDGTVPAKDFYWVVPDDWGSGIDEIYMPTPVDTPPSLLAVLPWDGLPLKPGLVPIGGDGCFGYLLLSIRPEDYGSVHFCCTWSEDGVTDVFESQGFWRIADSFSDFIANLEESPDEE